MKTHSASIVVLWALACTGGDHVPNPDSSVAEVDASPSDATGGLARIYEHVIPGCGGDPLVNCRPSVELCSDGVTVYMQVTDIMNRGSYARTETEIVATFPAADVPSTVRFALVDDSLIDDWLFWTWLAVSEGDARATASQCAP